VTIVNEHLHYSAHNTPIESFAGFLTTQLSGGVTDETGLRGEYDITLDFMPDDRWRGFISLPKANTPTTEVPNLFSAIQEQLGLRLDSRKGQVALLVVDHADKVPTEN